jgi:aspartyl-tRNA(Asn)/glutamyl-tRNA(Gln) amidotransferase subunit A
VKVAFAPSFPVLPGRETRLSKVARIHDPSALGAFASVADAVSGEGLAIAVKENIAVAGLPRRAGSPLRSAQPCDADAPVVANLRAAGCAIVGTTSMHELALGVSGDNTHFGNVLNPLDWSRIAGGSSSGSAVAVAAGMCDAALGTDTGGSVRLPAALCGVVGFKPRRDTLSRDGVVRLSGSLDTVGVIAPDVKTAAEVTALAAGPPLSPPAPPAAETPRLGVPLGWLAEVDLEVLHPFLEATAGPVEVEFGPRAELADQAGTISLYEAAIALREFGGERSGVGPDVAELLARGAAISPSEYAAARDGAAAAREALAAALATVDALVVPSVPCVAPRRGSEAAAARARLTGWLRPFNLTDTPALTLPLPTPGLPAGIQVVAADESKTLAVAAALERRLTPN